MLNPPKVLQRLNIGRLYVLWILGNMVAKKDVVAIGFDMSLVLSTIMYAQRALKRLSSEGQAQDSTKAQ